jgi:hypothetical protein
LRLSIIRQDESQPDWDQPVRGCPVNLAIVEGRWIAEIQDSEACALTVADMRKLGPEARCNLARHLQTDDQRLGSDIRQMRRRT